MGVTRSGTKIRHKERDMLFLPHFQGIKNGYWLTSFITLTLKIKRVSIITKYSLPSITDLEDDLNLLRKFATQHHVSRFGLFSVLCGRKSRWEGHNYICESQLSVYSHKIPYSDGQREEDGGCLVAGHEPLLLLIQL